MKNYLGMMLVLMATGVRAADEGKPRFKVTTAKPADTVTAQADGANGVIAVQSPSGIGSATIERLGEKWPATVTIQLRLKGLESFAASNGKEKVSAAVASGTLKVRQWKDDKENEPLTAGSAWLLGLQILDAGGQPARKLPLKNGSFVLILPKALLAGNPKNITLKWIDFYR